MCTVTILDRSSNSIMYFVSKLDGSGVAGFLAMPGHATSLG